MLVFSSLSSHLEKIVFADRGQEFESWISSCKKILSDLLGMIATLWPRKVIYNASHDASMETKCQISVGSNIKKSYSTSQVMLVYGLN